MRLFEHPAPRVKICGITTEADARMCINAGADALGFNFYSDSKRYIDPATALPWISSLQGAADRVAVVVNASLNLVKDLWDSGCFEMIQFHGDETPLQCETTGVSQWMKAVRARDAAALAHSLEFSTPQILLDAWSPTGYGGTGEVADWKLIRDFIANSRLRKYVLAGGLTPLNVAQAIAEVQPWAVDVAGGVETSPGFKDPSLVKSFILEAKKTA
ncbi:phosphoribosylanthranilate isomerase [bacterium]|jgi:phosphoribosylanthranilate isomerase|nr:phosphoribosylanthranilate isomerase [bacterium]